MIDAETSSATLSRRSLVRGATLSGAAIALLAGAPGLARPVLAQSMDDVRVLNTALSLERMRAGLQRSEIDIEVDGGVKAHNAAQCVAIALRADGRPGLRRTQQRNQFLGTQGPTGFPPVQLPFQFRQLGLRRVASRELDGLERRLAQG